MKKYLLLAVFFVCRFSLVTAQNPVPNSSFENWTNDNPDNWVTNNSLGLGLNPITQVSPGNGSSSAVKGEVISLSGNNYAPQLFSAQMGAQSGFPVTQAFNNLSFYYKLVKTVPSDQIYVYTVLQDINGNGVGSGVSSITQASNIYTLANCPINYFGTNPTNAVLSFTITDAIGLSGGLGSYFIIDDVALDFSSGVKEITESGFGNIYPNPVSNSINVSFHQHKSGLVNISIYDMQGRFIKELINENQNVGYFKIADDVSDFNNGVYQCIMKSNGSVVSSTFQVQH